MNKDGEGLYKNYKLEVKVKDNDRVSDFRDKIYEKYGITQSSYVMSWVTDNKMQHIFNNNLTINEVQHTKAGVMLLFEIPE